MNNNQWISIEDDLPDLEEFVLALDSNRVVRIGYRTYKIAGKPFWKYVDISPFHRATHWMPLPEAPKDHE